MFYSHVVDELKDAAMPVLYVLAQHICDKVMFMFIQLRLNTCLSVPLLRPLLRSCFYFIWPDLLPFSLLASDGGEGGLPYQRGPGCGAAGN